MYLVENDIVVPLTVPTTQAPVLVPVAPFLNARTKTLAVLGENALEK